MTAEEGNKGKRTVVYRDEKNDEFSGISRNTIRIDEGFRFIHTNVFWRAAAFVVYRIIMTPVAFLYLKFKYHAKFIGREKLKGCKDTGCLLLANHTMTVGDAYVPSVLAFPKRAHVIVNADNLSIPGLKNYIQMCGAIPIPQTVKGMCRMDEAVLTRLKEKCCVAVYPEAHIWPYYTKIRPFPSTSLNFAIKAGVPVFTSVATYHRRKHGSSPDVTVYVDGPFYPDAGLDRRDAREKLRSAVYDAMCRRAELNTYEVCHYVKEETDD